MKIGGESKTPNKDQILQALKTVALAGAGTGAGVYAAGRIQKRWPDFLLARKPVTHKMLAAAKIGLPILGFASGILGSRYRTSVDEGMFGKKQLSNARR